ncbi:glycosyltransferase [Clostridium sp. cel8]|jgi:hypothetical protein|uniref:glycosyltransferase family 32 protein n=1 Tax=Clostridium sp. cel8 TaxID=2663123 RepID=UPI001FAE5046|nr:glycosyltransferase [Clostridium sp. cel8]
MIPKIIHYCWFGGAEKNKDVRKCISSWQKILPDYEIKEWNEENFDISTSCDYVKEAYQRKKWAFVTDYVRLFVLYKYGGIYLDTDVMVIKSFNPLLTNKAFMCAESQFSICTATIGATKNSKLIGRILDLYKGKHFVHQNGRIDETPNSQLIYNMLIKEDNYQFDTKIFTAKDYVIYPTEFFSPINCYTMKIKISPNTYSIHYYAGTWKTSRSKIKNQIEALITRIIGERNRQKIKRLICNIRK